MINLKLEEQRKTAAAAAASVAENVPKDHQDYEDFVFAQMFAAENKNSKVDVKKIEKT